MRRRELSTTSRATSTNCFSVIRSNANIHTYPTLCSHENCTTSNPNYLFPHLEDALTNCTNKLSRIMFMKKTLRDDKTW